MDAKGYNSNKNLILFFSISLLWTWLAGMLPVFLKLTGTPLGTFIFYSGGGAPSIVAVILVFTTYPKAAKKDYFSRCFSLKKMGLRWALFTIALFATITIIAVTIATTILKMDLPGMDWLHIAINQPYMIPLLLFFSLISGPLNEEFGWRGYSLDRLLTRFGFINSSLLLGFIWAAWHLPWFFTPGQFQYDQLQRSLFDGLMFFPYNIALSFIVSFVYINTKRSILAGAFVHMMSNFITSQLLIPYDAAFGNVIRNVHLVISSLVILYALSSANFKKRTAQVIDEIKEDNRKFSQDVSY